MAKQGKKAGANQRGPSLAETPMKMPPQDNRATICDYNQNLLGGVIEGLKIGQKVTLQVRGEVSKLEERYTKSKNGSYSDPYNNRCEIELVPTSVSVGGGSMVSQMNSERKKRGGSHYGDDEGDE